LKGRIISSKEEKSETDKFVQERWSLVPRVVVENSPLAGGNHATQNLIPLELLRLRGRSCHVRY